MSVVKLEKGKQKAVKVLSKIIAILARIGWICSIVGIIFIALIALIIPIALKDVSFEDNKIVVKNNTIEIVEQDEKLVLKHNNTVIASESDQEAIEQINKFINDNKNKEGLLIGYCETVLILVIVCLVLSILMLRRIDTLFNNISKEKTPFILENVEHIKKIAYFMIALIIMSNIVIPVTSLILKQHINISLDLFNIVEILMVFVIAYIFEYGYSLQSNSKVQLYDSEKE